MLCCRDLKLGGIFFLALFILGCASRQTSPKEKYREARELMGTVASIDVCRDNQNKEGLSAAYAEVWQRLEEISWRMNVFDEKSDVAKVNNAGGNPVVIEPDTYQVLKDSVYFSELSKGAFDITVWPLIHLWKESAKKNILPDPSALAVVKEAVGARHVGLLGSGKVQLLHPQTKIDLGGIAAGYAVDEAVRIFRAQGIVNFFIDIGGDIYAGGLNCEGEPWRIGVRDPRDRFTIIDVIGLSNAAVTTSGNYEKFYEIQNQRWSHIINPLTGYPQQEVVSATMIAPTTEEADAIATALCVLGSQEATTLVNSMDPSYASLIIIKQVTGEIVQFPSQSYEEYRLKN